MKKERKFLVLEKKMLLNIAVTKLTGESHGKLKNH